MDLRQIAAELATGSWILITLSVFPVRRARVVGSELQLWITDTQASLRFTLSPTRFDHPDDGVIVFWNPTVLSVQTEDGSRSVREFQPALLVRQDRFDMLCASC